jgi:tRNA1(Val) A37 N6-methylase TrmN6
MTDKDFEKLKKIEKAILAFDSRKLYETSIEFFNALDYQSTKTVRLSPNNFKGFVDSFNLSETIFNPDKAMVKDWNQIEFLFQFGDSELTMIPSLFDTNKVNPNEFQSFLFFAIQLKEKSYNRGDLVKITREMNRPFNMPVIVLFVHGNKLTLSIIDRRLNKIDSTKDVLEKVTLIKDINIAEPQRAHKEILKDLSLNELYNKHDFKSFIELHKAWKATLNISELNKKFFQELADWYFWAMDKVQFPDDIEKKADIRNPTNLIRLITRVVFIWFIKEKGLVPESLFKKTELKKNIKDFNTNKGSRNFYNAVLQNLFFGTLNQKMSDRDFAEDHERKNKLDQGVKNLYRYTDKFNLGKEEIKALFKDVPFLNGGLFDCLDKFDEEKLEKGKKDQLFVDGFTRLENKQAIVPDFLFFGDETEADLTTYYNPEAKKPILKKVKGLIDILNNYKFTVAENTPIEEEIALDPELLGKVFENLLASYNPETQTTARKQTGSFYTPREIVNYMVDESLLEYLKQKAKIDSPDFENRLRKVFSYSEIETNKLFEPEEKKAIIEALNNCKILDPACGSGAFPMGVLHKMVNILQKLDPENKLWKAEQREKVIGEQIRELEKDKKAIQGLSDREVKKKATEAVDERLKEIEEIFESKNYFDDYARKLFLIENCIYGVDIQPIAVQISKLRCFISLIIDQDKDASKENMGFRALPNLETKFVAANTLIGLQIPTINLFSENNPIKPLQDELKEVRHRYFDAKTRKEKLDFQKRDKELRKALSEKLKTLLVEQNNDEIAILEGDIALAQLKLHELQQGPEEIEITETTNLFGQKEQKKTDKKQAKIKFQKAAIKNLEEKLKLKQNTLNKDALLQVAHNIATFDPYDQNHFANWFEPEWMFGNEVKDGFDVVIGNPPYVEAKKLKNISQILRKFYYTYSGTADLYVYFYENGIRLLKEKGTLVFITSNKFIKTSYGENLRKYFTGFKINEIVDFTNIHVFEALVASCVFSISKTNIDSNKLKIVFADNTLTDFSGLISFVEQKKFYIPQKGLSEKIWQLGHETKLALKEKIENGSITLLNTGTVKIFRDVTTGYNPAFIIDCEKKNELLNEDKANKIIIKPMLQGRNIRKWIYDKTTDFLIFTRKGINIQEFPSIKAHLNKFKQQLEPGVGRKPGKYNWYEIQDNTAYYPEFEKEKIIWGLTSDKWTFAYDNEKNFLPSNGYILTSTEIPIKYLLALLNSRLMEYYFNFIGIMTAGGAYTLKYETVIEFPIKVISSKDSSPFIILVDQILSAKKENPQADTSLLERKIDELVYKLYELSYDEVKIIDKDFWLGEAEYNALVL